MSEPPAPAAAAPMPLRRASAVLASGTLVSRLLGFVSASILAWTIGQQNQGANAFALAMQLPNNIYAIIAGGLLSAVLVPQIVRAALHDDGGERFVNRLVTLGALVFLGVTVVATLCAPLLISLYANQKGQLGGQGMVLATLFAYWSLPQILFYALYSLLGEVLNARGVFGPFTWAPVLNNIVAIAALLTFAALYGTSPAHDDAGSWTPGMVALIAGGATVGVALQAFVLTLFWRRTGLRFRPDFRWRGVGLGGAGRAAAWTFAMILVTQLAGIVQSQVATLADADDASSAVLRTSWLIFMLPHSILAVSIATPYFTRMSAHARDGDLAAVRRDLSSSLRTIGLMITGSCAALLAAAVPFAAFFAGEGDLGEVAGISGVLLAYLGGLVPFSVLFLLQRTYYALGDTRTPFFFTLVQASLFVIGAVSVSGVPSEWLGASIAGVTTLAGAVQLTVAAVVLRRKLGGLGGAVVGRRFGVYALATIPAVAAGLLALWALGGFDWLDGVGGIGFALAGKAESLLTVATVGATTLAVYAGVLALLRVPELRALVGAGMGVLRRR